MRLRLTIMVALLAALSTLSVSAPAHARPVLAQQENEQPSDQGELPNAPKEGFDEDTDAGETDRLREPEGGGVIGEEEQAPRQEQRDDEGAAEEVGAGEGQQEEAAEAGPPWTYQMARIAIVLLVAMFIAIGGAYYRFVAVRARGA